LKEQEMVKHRNIGTIVLCAGIGVAGAAFAQGTIAPPANDTGQGASSRANSGATGTETGTVAGSDRNTSGGASSSANTRGRDADEHSSGTANESASAYGSNGTSRVASNQNGFDPSSLKLGKTATPEKNVGPRNKARVEANERRITAELNRAAAQATEPNRS
jgi:hypothetical protein